VQAPSTVGVILSAAKDLSSSSDARNGKRILRSCLPQDDTHRLTRDNSGREAQLVLGLPVGDQVAEHAAKLIG
jgi:hypothetical protein